MSITLINEADLAQAMVSRIEPFWQDAVTQAQFRGAHGVTVHYAWAIPQQPTQAVLISSGRIESLLKYKEVMFDLYQQGAAVFILDHRGQGLSGRMSDNPQHGYVARFDDYVSDLLYFRQHIIPPLCRLPVQLLCHSMGGAIGTLAMLTAPDAFTRAVLCAPMFGIRPALPAALANLLVWAGSWVNRRRGQPVDYFFGQRGYQEVPFTDNKLTHSEVRYQLFRQLYARQPEIQLGGVTPQWLGAARQAMQHIEQHASQLSQPVLLFSAGDDKVVDNRAQARVAAKMPACEQVTIDGAAHELLIEADRFRQPVMQQAWAFLSADT